MARILGRRAFLGGAAVALGLPLLDAMRPRSARGATARPPTRLLCYYLPNGALMGAWTPSGEGAAFTLSPTLASLEPVRDDVLVISGLENGASDPGAPGHHAAGTAGFLTAARALRSESALQLATSIDQLYARELVGETPLASLQLGVDGGGAIGDCDNGYACAYSRAISWSGPATPMPKITAPRVAFDLLFGGYDPKASAEERATRRARRRSVLDAVRGDARRLTRELDGGDRLRLDEYLEGVRALELRVEQTPPSCDVGGFDPDPDPERFPEVVDAMTDLMVLALRCDATRVITFMLGNSASRRSYPFIGVSSAHHDLSHHAGDFEKVKALQAIEAWEVARFADLLARMRAVPEGDGTLLDHSLVLLGSELSNGNSHTHDDLPVLVAGRASGAIEPGRHLVFPDGAPYGGLLASILEALEVPTTELSARGHAPLVGL
ncbi:MAG: DUF1552 domain-containing protein [Nannocystaceae bacterium]|nr:DUF1552 domain-containing protein [Myxococcales bacterium]